MRYTLSWICIASVVTGCSDSTPQEPEAPSSETEYVGFLVNTANHSIRRIGAETESPRLQLIPNNHFDLFNVLDATGRASDQVWIQDDRVYDWNQYKSLADTPSGPLILHQRFQPEFPEGNPWSELLIDPSKGETGVGVDSRPHDLLRERVYLVYVFESAGLLTASYDPKGNLIVISARYDGNATFYFPRLGWNNQFAGYKLPETVSNPMIGPPMNDSLRNGLDKITSSRYPHLPLVGVFIAEQFDLGRLFTIHETDANGKTVNRKVVRFKDRPYDRAIIASNRPAR